MRYGCRYESKRVGDKKITEVEDAQELMKIFQDFYTMTGRLPLSNSLLVYQREMHLRMKKLI